MAQSWLFNGKYPLQNLDDVEDDLLLASYASISGRIGSVPWKFDFEDRFVDKGEALKGDHLSSINHQLTRCGFDTLVFKETQVTTYMAMRDRRAKAEIRQAKLDKFRQMTQAQRNDAIQALQFKVETLPEAARPFPRPEMVDPLKARALSARQSEVREIVARHLKATQEEQNARLMGVAPVAPASKPSVAAPSPSIGTVLADAAANKATGQQGAADPIGQQLTERLERKTLTLSSGVALPPPVEAAAKPVAAAAAKPTAASVAAPAAKPTAAPKDKAQAAEAEDAVSEGAVSLLGRNLRTLRLERGLTPFALERESGVSQGTVYRVESGRVQTVRSPALAKLAEALGTTIEWLVTGNGVREVAKAKPAPKTKPAVKAVIKAVVEAPAVPAATAVPADGVSVPAQTVEPVVQDNAPTPSVVVPLIKPPVVQVSLGTQGALALQAEPVAAVAVPVAAPAQETVAAAALDTEAQIAKLEVLLTKATDPALRDRLIAKIADLMGV